MCQSFSNLNFSRRGDRHDVGQIALDGTPVYSPQRLQWILSKRRAGEAIKINVRRGDAETGEVLERSVAPAPSNSAADAAVAPSAPGTAWLGIRMEPMDKARRQQYAVPLDRGVLIADVGTGSPAAKAGVVSGGVLRASIAGKSNRPETCIGPCRGKVQSRALSVMASPAHADALLHQFPQRETVLAKIDPRGCASKLHDERSPFWGPWACADSTTARS
jgi:hypothetical protein